jgi:predicted nucleic acid-binding protein
MRVLLDTNVVLDAMLQRQPWHVEADAILRAAGQGQVFCATTGISLATAFYVGRRIIGTGLARAGIRNYLQAFEILTISKQTLADADTMPGNDFEDNIQIAAAVANSVDAIVTRNVGDFSCSPIPVWSPADLLQRLPGTGQAPPTTTP